MRTLLGSVSLLACMLAASPAHAQPTPAAGPGTVTLPRADYDRLLDLVRRTPPRPPLPVAGAVHRAELRLRASDTDARATMTVDGEVFGTGIFEIPLARGDTLLSATTDGRPMAIVTDGGVHSAILTGPGVFSATLEFGVPLAVRPGLAAAALPLPVAPSAAVVVDVPGNPPRLTIAPGEILRRAAADGRTIVEAVIPAVEGASVEWSTAAVGTPAREARYISDVKTLITIDETDTRLLALVDVTVLRGAPDRFLVRLPADYTFLSAAGTTVERTEMSPGAVTLFTRSPEERRQQFVISLERSSSAGSFRLASGVPAVDGAQRETGEIAVEGRGTLDISAARTENVRRIDVQEVTPRLAAGASQVLLAFRYHRQAAAAPLLALDVKRFGAAAVLAAVAERAVATTLVTSQGRMLTEISMWVRNRAQPFMKIGLPAGSSLLTVEVGGGPAKPVEAADGLRVPLLRPGFRADGVYQVSFVYITSQAPFAKKGTMQLTLPRMDLPVNVVEWELFVPDRYKFDRFTGNALAADLVGPGALVETVTVAAEAPGVAGQTGGGVYRPGNAGRDQPQQQPPSQNVQSLQRRASGVLPVRIDVPRAGTSYAFVRPLTIDEEVEVAFRYRQR